MRHRQHYPPTRGHIARNIALVATSIGFVVALTWTVLEGLAQVLDMIFK